jgi:hypothetical protein
VVTLALLLGVMVASGATAQAQYRDYGGSYGTQYGTWPESRTRDYAYKLGYHTGYSESRQAQNRGHRGSYRDLPGYRNDNNGYRVFMGHENSYRSQYRRGYEAGFNDLRAGRQRKYDRGDVERALGGNLDDVYRDDDDRWYDRDDNWWDRKWPNRRNDRWDDRDGNMSRQELYRIAQQNGYRDGVRRGQEDRARNRRSDFDNHREYREAMNGYRNEYRSREYYQQAYREGFRSGYEDGYRRNNSGRRFPWPF